MNEQSETKEGILALIVLVVDLVLLTVLAREEARRHERVNHYLEQLEAIHAQEH